MKKKVFSICILLVFSLSLALPTGPSSASATSSTHFSGTEGANLCGNTPPDPRCTPGHLVTLPNGQVILTDTINVIEFQTSDPRFTGEIVVHFTFYPTTDQGTLVTGNFRFYPDSIHGYWEGAVAGFLPATGGVTSTFYAKGYGALQGLLLKGTNTNGQIEGEIIGMGKL